MKELSLIGLIVGVALLQTGAAQVLEDAAAKPTTAAEQPLAASQESLSPAVSEVVHLAESGVSDEVVVGYIKGARTRFKLSAEVILYLKDFGSRTRNHNGHARPRRRVRC